MFKNNILNLIIILKLINLTLTKILDPIVWSIYSDRFKSTNTKEEYVIDVRLGEFLNIICPKYSINDDDKNLIEYHTLYKVSKSEYDSCQIQNTFETKQILRCDKPFDNVKYTLYISSYSPVPDAIEFIPGNSYYFISTSNTTFNGMNNTNGGTCLTNNMKIVVRVLDPNREDTTTTLFQPATTTTNVDATKSTKLSSSSSSSLTLSNSDSVHTTNNLINSNLLYKFITTTIKPLIKTRIFNNKKHKTVFRQQLVEETLTTRKSTKTKTTTTTTNDDLIIIQPDVIYSDLFSLLQQQQQQQQQTTTRQSSSPSLLAYFQINKSITIKSNKISLIILLTTINFILDSIR